VIRQLGIVTAEVIASQDAPLIQQALVDFSHGLRALNDKLLEEQAIAFDGISFQLVDESCRVVRLVIGKLSRLAQAVLAHSRHVDGRRKRVERLVAADVAGCLVAPDMLFAGAERQHIAALAFDIHGLPDDPACGLSDIVHLHGVEADVRASEAERIAHRLAFATRHVRAIVAGRCEEPQADWVDGHDKQRARSMHLVSQRLHLTARVEPAEEVRILHYHAGNIFVSEVCQRIEVAQGSVLANRGDAHALDVGVHHLAVLRIQCRAKHDLEPLAAADL